MPDRRSSRNEDAMRRTVDEWLRTLAGDDRIQYETRLDAPEFIKRFVVGRKSSTQASLSDALISFVRDHLESYVSDQGANRRERTLRELGRSLLVKAHSYGEDGKKITEYKPVSEVHLPAGYQEGSHWAEAARGTPGIWWIDWHYRKKLARPDEALSVSGFLTNLCAAKGPRLQLIPSNALHNFYRFTNVTRGEVLGRWSPCLNQYDGAEDLWLELLNSRRYHPLPLERASLSMRRSSEIGIFLLNPSAIAIGVRKGIWNVGCTTHLERSHQIFP